MLDFLKISHRNTKGGTIEVYPKFIIPTSQKSSDLMIRGGDFYAIWIEERGLWSTDEKDALYLIDRELDKYVEENRSRFESKIKMLYMWDAESGMIDRWHKYCQKQMRDSFHVLDENLVFANMKTKKKDYISKKLEYPLEAGDISAYDKLISTLYSKEERHKIEWAIGSIVTGDSKKIQKFLVLYGPTGTGKSTILNIIQSLFEGYYSVFDAKALGSSNGTFALEAFRHNPLVAIQHDGDLSKIEDNTRLNSLVAHELMTVNEKFKTTYSTRFKCFLFMGTNKPVKITDAKSGLIRRLIDVTPSGEKLGLKEYKQLMKQINFELGAIAYHCKELYLQDPNKYDDYVPITMLGASNDFYNFIIDSYHVFIKEDGTTLKSAWELYKTYCDEAKVSYPYSQRIFKEELRNYFTEYNERYNLENGSRVRSYYSGFKKDKFKEKKTDSDIFTLKLTSKKSSFDKLCSEYPAQYANEKETPVKKWADVKTKLSDINTSELHYVKVPKNHIVIDFDIPDSDGKKSRERNLEEASKFPPTYAEFSKSGNGIHLHYIYAGDVDELARMYADNIEIKTFVGKSSLRRKLSKCNNLSITTISSGLPLKGKRKVINFESFKNEKHLRTLINKNLKKEIHPSTKSSIDFIFKNLEDAYKGGLKYDVTDMRNTILLFAESSTNQSDYCVKLVNKMQFKSSDISEQMDSTDERLVFFDVEVFINLFIVNWKFEGKDVPIVRMINPKPSDIEELLKFKLVGFNCRRYDNHILYAALMGYSNEQLYNYSQKIISNSKNSFFGEAYNLSYTDVYDFSSKKQSLKKFQIDLGLKHKELGLPWDQPVPEDMWIKVAEYCDNDVLATEAVFNHLKGDFLARQILADVAGTTVNDTTNSLTTRIIFGSNRKPQDVFNYRNMAYVPDEAVVKDLSPDDGDEDSYTLFDEYDRPLFKDYVFDNGISTYRDEVVGEGGYVYSEPGMYGNVAVLDIASMHPYSIVAENLFGDEYTQRFRDILDARMAIKRREFTKAKKMLGGKLAKYLDDESAANDLAYALKIAINSVYGLTSASFNNPFRDIRNKDNIVAKRGALFMINLKHEVQKRGFKVIHIKTDSIKIPDATRDIIDFIMDYGSMYGYKFEHETTFDKFCLVNDAVYIAKVRQCLCIGVCICDGKTFFNVWTATGTQFAVPYVFKTLFSKEEVIFQDLCETKSVATALYLDMNESLSDDEHDYRFIGRVGQFCPMKDGTGGGLLLRETLNKKTGEKGYASVTGTKGYRWLESEMVKSLGKEKDIDISYYEKLVDEAKKAISNQGDYEWFVSNDPYIGPICKECKKNAPFPFGDICDDCLPF